MMTAQNLPWLRESNLNSSFNDRKVTVAKKPVFIFHALSQRIFGIILVVTLEKKFLEPLKFSLSRVTKFCNLFAM